MWSSCVCSAHVQRRTASLCPQSIDLVSKTSLFRSRQINTCKGDRKEPHSWTNFVNMLYGPHFSTLRRRPNTDSSSYVMPMSACRVRSGVAGCLIIFRRTSSACTYVSVIGSSSAVGTALRKLHFQSTQNVHGVGKLSTWPVLGVRKNSQRKQ